MFSRAVIGGLTVVLLAACSRAPADPPSPPFSSVVNRYFSRTFEQRPVLATQLGVHTYDAELHRLDGGWQRERGDFLRSIRGEISAYSDESLDATERLDRRILLARIDDELFELSVSAPWRRDPGFYNTLISNAVLPLVERPFAPKSERLRFLIERERRIPQLLEDAKRNLDDPSRILTQTAIEQFRGSQSFFTEVAPRAFEDTAATAMFVEFQETNAVVLQSIRDFVTFLETRLLPVAREDTGLGADWLEQRLASQEMVSEPLSTIERRGDDELKRQTTELKATAGRLNPGVSVEAALRDVFRTHGDPSRLIPEVRSLLEELRSFSLKSRFVTIPSEVRCEVTETAPFARALGFASLDIPGPYEPVHHEAYFKITLPDPEWSPARQAQHLRFFSSAALPTLSAYETYPGRYLHYLWMKTVPSQVRRVLRSDFFMTGWAHYVEELVLQQGFRSGDQRVLLAQQRNAVLRAARLVAAVRLHTGRMTPAAAVDFFMTEAYQERESADREMRRALGDPMRAMAYTWGKLQILELRSEFQRKQGNAFSLKSFHDELLRHGAPPLPLLRQFMFSGVPGRSLG